MKKLFSRIFSGVAAAAMMSVFAVSAGAEEASLDCADKIEADAWSLSVKSEYGMGGFDATRLTPDSTFVVEYTVSSPASDGGAPIEMIFQSWSNPETPMVKADGGVWAKVAPSEYDDTTATFVYEDIVEAYGTDNYDKVDCIGFGATSSKLTVDKVTVTNVLSEGEGTHWVDPTIEADKKAAEKAAEKDKTKTGIIWAVIGIVAGVAIAVAIIWIIISRKSRDAFDISTGSYVDKKDALDKDTPKWLR